MGFGGELPVVMVYNEAKLQVYIRKRNEGSFNTGILFEN